MLIEVTYQTTKDAAKKYSQLRRTEFFESSTLPDTPTIIKQLTGMRKDFAENTVLISEFERDDIYSLRDKGFRITQIWNFFLQRGGENEWAMSLDVTHWATRDLEPQFSVSQTGALSVELAKAPI